MKNTRLILIIAALVCSYNLSSQNIVKRSFNTGYVSTNQYTLATELAIKNDSLLSFINFETKSGAGLDYILDYRLRKTDLSISNIDTLWNTSGKSVVPFIPNNYQGIFASYLTDEKNSQEYYYSVYQESSTDMRFTFMNTLNGIKKDTLFDYTVPSRAMSDKPLVYDSSVYLFNINFSRDTVFLQRFDFFGNLLNENYSTSNDINNWQLNFQFLKGPVGIHPNNDSLILFETFYHNSKVFLVNRFTLDTAASIARKQSNLIFLFGNYKWGTLHASSFHYDSSGFNTFGTLVRLPLSFPSGGITYFNFGKIRFDWNNNMVSYKAYGEKDVYSRGYGYDKVGANEYMVGSSPFFNSDFNAQEYRKILLFRESSFGLDSIFIDGNKNHVATNVIADDNGDVFIKSQYSNAWSDDSLFYEVTKVPGTILTSIKEQQFATSVQIYPNPTSQFLHSDEFTVGKEYQIYTSSGQIILVGAIGSNKEVDVRSLKKGVYFIQLIDRGKQSHRSTVFIKD